MKPSPQISDNVSSECISSNAYELDSVDYGNLNVYEFQETEDVYGIRSRGYQKPKQMWMAKDQALTNFKPESPNTLQQTLESSNNSDQQLMVNELVQSDSNDANNNNNSTEIESDQTQSVVLSCPIKEEPTLEFDSTSKDETKDSHHIPSNEDPRPGLKTKLIIGPKKKKCKRAKTLKTLSCSSVNLDSNSLPAVTNTDRKNKKKKSQIVADTNMTTTADNILPDNSTYTSSPTSFDAKDDLTETDPNILTNSSVLGGLKIRLRRDFTLDPNICKTKRAKSKQTTTSFRIVESWCDADAPGGDYSRRVRAANNRSTSPTLNMASGGLRVGDLVWAKLAGYPYWPSQISAIWARTVHQLSQATLPPNSKLMENGTSLSVLATPSDPSLAAGYTARVDWLAWDQCSYLSCSKLYSFKEAYDKLYNPRTRVKGYTEAVRLAKQCISGMYMPNGEQIESQNSNFSPINKSHSSLSNHLSAPPSTDSQWSAMTTLSSFDPSIPGQNQLITKDLMGTSNIVISNTNTTTTTTMPLDNSVNVKPNPSAFLNDSNISQNQSIPGDPFSSATGSTYDGIDDKNTDLLDLKNIPLWAPLPQLDVSGLGVFHVPSFSEDEDDFDKHLTSPLEFDFGSCM